MNNIRILIVDDDFLFCNLIKEKIESMYDFVTIFFTNNEKNIENFHEIDIFIVDNYINGEEKSIKIIDQIRKIKRFENSIIYVTTGHGNYELLKNLINKNIAGFLDKNDLTYSIITESIETIFNIKKNLNNIYEKITGI